VHVPAFCDKCGAVFGSGFVADNSTNMTFVGNRAGPCPACGGMGHTPDGVFNFVGNTIEILSAPQRTVEELSRLAKIIGEAKGKNRSPEQVSETIRNEIPELTSFADSLPKTRTELYAFLTLAMSAITLLTQCGQSGGNTTNVTINQTINQTIIDTDKTSKPKTASSQQPKQASQKIGRNEPCPCKSGKKYKKCCGQIP
jgi:SEC-C motif